MANWLAYIYNFLTADPRRMMVIGSFIGAMPRVCRSHWFFSWRYYRRPAEELRDAANEVQREAQHLRDLVLLEEKGGG